MKITLRSLIALLLVAFSFSLAQAGPVSSNDAGKAARSFLKMKDKINAFNITAINPYIENGETTLYMISLSPEGFILLSADDLAQPVLGYSFENDLPLMNEVVNFSEWMQGFSKYVTVCSENPQFQLQEYQQQWSELLGDNIETDSPSAVVGPLLTSTWNQSFPYNSECPEAAGGSGGHVYAGCVATAMAQVMYYYRFPQTGTGSYGYTHYEYGYLFADFGATEYKWNEMANSAGTNYFQLAQLQSHLGISVDMDYSPDGSGAYSQDAVYSLKTYFGYSDDLTLIFKDEYSDAAWKEVMKENIDNGHPMYYHGFGSGGHAFNLDGYDGDYFHFNWGWGGSANGYFSLNNLNPSGSNFSYGQGAIVNFYPGDGYPYQCNALQTLTTHTGSIEDGSGPLNDYLPNSDCGWLITVNDSLSSLKLTFSRFEIESGQDSLFVYAGYNSDAPLLGVYTGNTIPAPIEITSSQMYINFKTDGQNNTGGWFATYKATPVTYCNGVDTYTDTVATISDGSGTFDYHNGSTCMFKIAPTGAKSITLDFSYFQTYDENDYIKITDLNNGNELFRFFGSTNPGEITINSGKIIVLFKSDGENTAGGWSFTYQASTITSNVRPDLFSGLVTIYPQPAQSEVTIEANTDKNINAVAIYSTDGKLVYNSNGMIDAKTTKLDVSALNKGMYLVAIEIDGVRIMKKLIIAD